MHTRHTKAVCITLLAIWWTIMIRYFIISHMQLRDRPQLYVCPKLYVGDTTLPSELMYTGTWGTQGDVIMNSWYYCLWIFTDEGTNIYIHKQSSKFWNSAQSAHALIATWKCMQQFMAECNHMSLANVCSMHASSTWLEHLAMMSRFAGCDSVSSATFTLGLGAQHWAVNREYR